MGAIRRFFVRDVRCFEGDHTLEIRPLTFLVGENSTGKSTVLGCLHALGSFLEYRHTNIDFNSEPYQMGAFADIVRRSRPRKQDFQLGIELSTDGGSNLRFFVVLTEEERGSEPFFRSARWVFEDGEIALSTPDDGEEHTERGFRVTQSSANCFHIQLSNARLWQFVFFELPYMGDYLESTKSSSGTQADLGTAAKNLKDFINRQFSKDAGVPGTYRYGPLFGLHSYSIHSIAPVRSKPKRTYDPLKETETPDGSEIPVALMNLSVSRRGEWTELREGLLAFGRESGLFSDIALRRLGGSRGDPFQLQIKVSGPRANLMDVGYGVSQVLPILVRILTGRQATFLLQQPEVHLHPKGQAELASLLVDVHHSHDNVFVIETHSDHMIDRVRIEIRRGRIKPEDVSLIYLEPIGNHVRTHNIGFDARANMVGVPQHYRDFFLNEADRLLGLAD